MRTTLAGLLVGALVGLGIGRGIADAPHAHAQTIPPMTTAAGLASVYALAGATNGNQQTVLLIDPSERTLGSYHINLSTGQITLRCVRKFRWDLQMDQFNGTDPSPEQIQALLRPR